MRSVNSVNVFSGGSVTFSSLHCIRATLAHALNVPHVQSRCPSTLYFSLPFVMTDQCSYRSTALKDTDPTTNGRLL